MKKLISRLAIALAVPLASLMPVPAPVQASIFTQQPPVVEMETFLSMDKLHAGESAQIAVRLTVAETYHINAIVPTEEYMIPTKLEFPQSGNFTVGVVAYPKSIEREVSFSEKKLAVYEGTVTLFVPITAAKNLTPGKHILTGKLTYQACTDEACLAPKKVALEIPVEIVPPASKTSPANVELFQEKGKGH